MMYEDLPFVRRDHTGKVEDTWHVQSSGDFAKDCTTGNQYFCQLRVRMQETGNPTTLQRVVEGMSKKHQDWGGIETGFFHALGSVITS